jgi:phosphate transport system substrate-binding protein
MTVRFGAGLDLLDSRSRQDVQRLVTFLQRPENRARRILLMGFASPDPRQPYAALSLSQERADFVSSELLAANLKVVTVRGFGGQLPLAEGRMRGSRWRNERVEVWLR